MQLQFLTTFLALGLAGLLAVSASPSARASCPSGWECPATNLEGEPLIPVPEPLDPGVLQCWYGSGPAACAYNAVSLGPWDAEQMQEMLTGIGRRRGRC
jgi:hypothetical protein